MTRKVVGALYLLFNQKGMDPIVHYVPTRGNIIAGRLHFKNF